MALADLALEMLYVMAVLAFIGFDFEEQPEVATSKYDTYTAYHKTMGDIKHGPVEVATDNTGAYHLCNSSTTGQNSRHVERKVFKMRELRRRGVVKVIHVPTKDNAADLFTKGLDTPTFQRHRDTVYNTAARPAVD